MISNSSQAEVETADSAQLHARYPSLCGRRVVVTGGASGIGASLVAAFARQGASVAFLDIKDNDAATLCESLEQSAPGNATYRHCDLTDLGETGSVLQEVIDALGGVDVLINNAASDDRHTVSEVTPAFWEERMNVNLRHQFFAAQAVLPAMRAARRGVILNFGSISWHLGLADLVLYQTAKAAIEGLTRALAREVGSDGIRVNTIVPGNVQTPRQDMWYDPEEGRKIVEAQCLPERIQPEDVASLALFLASDDARMCTAHAYWVDAGWC